MAARWINPEDPPLLGGFEALAHTIEEIRTNTALEGAGFLLLDAGDIFQGTPEGNLTKGRIVVDWMNRLSYDAVALGNHELDYGQKVIGDLARRAHFPFLAANVTDRRLGRRPPWVRPWIIRHTGGLAVGIVGLTTSDMANLVTPEPLRGLSFGQEHRAAESAMAAALAAGADCIVLLTHCGEETDRRLAARLGGGAVVGIVGGHSHTRLEGLVLEDGTPIVQAGSRGLAVGVLELTIDPSRPRKLVGSRSRLMDVTAPPVPDPWARRIVQRYSPDIDRTMNRRVGELAVDLDRVRGLVSSSLGCFLADVMREVTGTDIGLHNKGGIRADLVTGPIRLRELYQVSPFDNTIYTLTLRGEQIREVLETMAARPVGRLELSGMTVVFDISQPAGSRVVEAHVAGKPLQSDKRYRVATNSFLAGGGDGHAALAAGEDRRDTGRLLRDVTVEWFEKHSPVKYVLKPRVEIRGNDSAPGGSE